MHVFKWFFKGTETVGWIFFSNVGRKVSRPALGWRDRGESLPTRRREGTQYSDNTLSRLNGMAGELHKFSAEAILNDIWKVRAPCLLDIFEIKE
jgi:hypothetical protein